MDVTSEIDPDVKTIADLPFHAEGRFPKALAVGRCRGDEIIPISSKEMLERIRDLSLGFHALGVRAGDRVALISESRPEWLLADLAVRFGPAGRTIPVGVLTTVVGAPLFVWIVVTMRRRVTA